MRRFAGRTCGAGRLFAGCIIRVCSYGWRRPFVCGSIRRCVVRDVAVLSYIQMRNVYMTQTYLIKVPSNRDFRRKDAILFLNVVSCHRLEIFVNLFDGMSSLTSCRQSP